MLPNIKGVGDSVTTKSSRAASSLSVSKSASLPQINSRGDDTSYSNSYVSSAGVSKSIDYDALESAQGGFETPSVMSSSTLQSDSSSLKARKVAQSLTMKQEMEVLAKKKAKEDKEAAKMKKLANVPKKYAPYVESLRYKEVQRAMRKKEKFKNHGSKFHVPELDAIFYVQAKEDQAAKVIQRFFRRSRVILPWRRAVQMVKRVISIQKVIRGFVTRKWVATWIRRKIRYVTNWQAFIRRYLNNKHLRPILAWESECVISIQRIVRGKLGRIRHRKVLLNMCAARIQILWRGVVARAQVDRLWLNKQVIPIQTAVRRLIAKRRCSGIRRELDTAALSIQARYRVWKAVTSSGDRLYNREMQNREDTITELRLEEEYCSELLLKLSNRLERIDLRHKVKHAAEEFEHASATIHQLEKDTVETRRQKEILSPRSIQQGWAKDLEGTQYRMQQDLIRRKLDCIFTKYTNYQALEFLLEHKVEEIERFGQRREQLSEWRVTEYAERRERSYWRGVLARRKANKAAIAAERRQWKVVWTTKNGKPDKLRRPGRPWDPSVFAGAEKQTYCAGAGVDLFAHNELTKVVPDPTSDTGYSTQTYTHKLGSEESVNHSLQQMSLQTYLDQVNHYDKMVQPLSDILSDHITGLNGREKAEAKARHDAAYHSGKSAEHPHPFRSSAEPSANPSAASHTQVGAAGAGFADFVVSMNKHKTESGIAMPPPTGSRTGTVIPPSAGETMRLPSRHSAARSSVNTANSTNDARPGSTEEYEDMWGYGEVGKELTPALLNIGAVEKKKPKTEQYEEKLKSQGGLSKLVLASLEYENSKYRMTSKYRALSPKSKAKRDRRTNSSSLQMTNSSRDSPSFLGDTMETAGTANSGAPFDGEGTGDFSTVNISADFDFDLSRGDNENENQAEAGGSAYLSSIMREEEEAAQRRAESEQRRCEIERAAVSRAAHRDQRRKNRKIKRERMAKNDLVATNTAARSKTTMIPWALLDELDAEKSKFANEKQFSEFASMLYSVKAPADDGALMGVMPTLSMTDGEVLD